FERGNLDIQPARELALVRPDPGHLGSGVARDHRLESRARAGRRPRRLDTARRASLSKNRHTLSTLPSHTRAPFAGILNTPGWVGVRDGFWADPLVRPRRWALRRRGSAPRGRRRSWHC